MLNFLDTHLWICSLLFCIYTFIFVCVYLYLYLFFSHLCVFIEHRHLWYFLWLFLSPAVWSWAIKPHLLQWGAFPLSQEWGMGAALSADPGLENQCWSLLSLGWSFQEGDGFLPSRIGQSQRFRKKKKPLLISWAKIYPWVLGCITHWKDNSVEV